MTQDLTFDQWVSWLLNHPGSGEIDILEPLSRTTGGADNALKAAIFATRLFKNIGTITLQFDPLAVDRALASFIAGLPAWLNGISTMTSDDRRALFRSMYYLYADYAVPQKLSKYRGPERVRGRYALEMWWDVMVFGSTRQECLEQEEACYYQQPDFIREVNDTILDVLKAILSLQDELCCRSALHGLNHLCHPLAKTVAEEYVANSRNSLRDWNLLDYAIQCTLGLAA